MILFRPEMVQAILDGRKVVTRRRWARPRVRVGAEHLCYARHPFARPPGKPFAKVRIVDVLREADVGGQIHSPSGGGDEEMEALREGFPSWYDFLRTWREMHGPDAVEEPCWRVEFDLVDAPRKGESDDN